MTKYKVIYSQKAYRDLVNIYNYILINSLNPKIANKLIGEIKEAIESLDILPFRHELIETSIIDFKDIRKLLVKNYIVLYRVDEVAKSVYIVRIVSCKRDYKRITETN